MKPEVLPVVLRALGLRVNPAIALAEDEFGPPAPATLSPIRRKPADPAALPLPPTREGRSPHSRPCAADAGRRRKGQWGEDQDWQRLDKWLWCARFMKARSDCARLISEGLLAHQPSADGKAACQAARGRRDHAAAARRHPGDRGALACRPPRSGARGAGPVSGDSPGLTVRAELARPGL